MATTTSFHRISFHPTAIAIRNALRTSALLSVVILSAGIAGCSSMSTLTMRPEIPPPAQQQRMGSRAFHHHLALYPPIEDSHDTAILSEVGQRLADASGRDDLAWEFVLTLDPAVRIRAFPGGKVVVSDGMLAACQSEAQLAAVMAHEIGHMLAGHSLPHAHPPGTHARPEAPRHAPDHGRHVETAGSHPNAYNIHQEQEADSIALSLLAQAGYDPEVIRSIWLAHGKHGDQLSANPSRHPLDHNRRISLMETLSQAKQVYRSHNDPRGSGQTIAYTARAPRESAPQIASAPTHPTFPGVVWSPAQRRGGAKPDGWSADLAEAQWLAPADAAHDPVDTVIQVEHEWTTPAESRTVVEDPSDNADHEAPQDGPLLRPILRDDLHDAGLRPIE